MKVVMAVAPESLLQKRRRTGADQWDEMWEGVLHMPPAPNIDHQDLEGAMEAWLRQFWVPMSGGKAHHQINVASVGGWPNDYRIPDLVVLKPDRFHIDKNEYYEGGPTVVVEIRSPEDETYDKFDFYARLRVPEIWVIERDSRKPEIHVLAGSQHGKLEHTADGQLQRQSPMTNIKMWADNGKLAMQLGDDTATLRFLP